MFQCTHECMTAFHNLKDVLTSGNIMAYPKDSGLLILDTDDSGTGIGGTLSQMQYCKKTGEKEERPNRHASKSLSKTAPCCCIFCTVL